MSNNKVYRFMRTALVVEVSIITVYIIINTATITGTDITSDCVTITTIPFSPTFREVSNLITTRILTVPSFCYHFGIFFFSEICNLCNSICRLVKYPLITDFLTSDYRCKVKSISVYSHFIYPISQ